MKNLAVLPLNSAELATKVCIIFMIERKVWLPVEAHKVTTEGRHFHICLYKANC